MQIRLKWISDWVHVWEWGGFACRYAVNRRVCCVGKLAEGEVRPMRADKPFDFFAYALASM